MWIKHLENYKIYIKFGKDIGPVQENIEMRSGISLVIWQTNARQRELLFEKMRGTELENLEEKDYKPNRKFTT
jgi:hypothetical protein